MFLQKGWTFVHCFFVSGDFPMTLRDAARISSEITSLREASAVLEDSPRGGANERRQWEFLFGLIQGGPPTNWVYNSYN